jgi:pimeloyl-ACP methyl ester carboxylesterase
MKPPETRYAKSGEVRIAYHVVGQGSLDLVFVPGFISNLEIQWEEPTFAELVQRLAAFSRLILLDKRGCGISERIDPRHPPTLADHVEDIRAVMNVTGSGRAALFGASEGAPICALFAATHPDRTRALILYGGYAHVHDWAFGAEALAKFIHEIERAWGTGSLLRHLAPGRAAADARFRSWWARLERLSATPTAAAALIRMNANIAPPSCPSGKGMRRTSRNATMPASNGDQRRRM